MDENEAYNRGLKGQKRGYLYDIMTNPNYGFTNATRQGAGVNLGFDVEMPQNPQEQQFLISEEMQRRFGQTAIDPRTGQPTRIIPGSVLAGLYSKETPMTKANQELDRFMYDRNTRYDASDLTSQYLGRSMNAFGLDLQQPDWNYYKTGDLQQKGTYLTSGQGIGGRSMPSQNQTFAQRQVPRQTGGSGKIDPASVPTTVNYKVNGKVKGSYNLPQGVGPVVKNIQNYKGNLSKIAQIGQTVIDPMTGQKKLLQSPSDIAQYTNDYNRVANKVLKQIYNTKPGQPIEVDSLEYDIAQGLNEVLTQEEPPDTSGTQPVPQLSWDPAGGFLDWGKQDSTVTMPGNNKITKLEKGGFLENGVPVLKGYLNQKYPEYSYLFNY